MGQSHPARRPVSAELFRTTHQDNLGSGGDAQPQDSRANSASFAVQKHLTVSLQSLPATLSASGMTTPDGQHSPSGVDDFRDTVLRDGTIRAQTERVETVIAANLLSR